MPSRPTETKEIQLLEGILAALKQPHDPERCPCCEELREIHHEIERSNRELERVNHHLHVISQKIDQLIPEPGDTTDTVQIAFGGNMPATPGTVAVGSTVVGSIVPLEADGVTVTPGAVVSAQGYAVDNAALVSFVVNPDGTATFTGVAAGTATVTATATVTDSGGAANTFTTTNTLTVTAPTGVTAGIQLNFA